MAKAINADCEAIEVFMCMDPSEPANGHMAHMIKPDNFMEYFHEIYPTFYNIPNLAGIHTFQDRSQFLDALKSIEWTSPCAKASYIDYLSAFENRRYSQYNHDYLFRSVSSVSDINSFFEKHRRVPQLEAPRSLRKIIENQKSDLGYEKYVTLNFRTRGINPNDDLDDADQRNADLGVWRDFLEECAEDNPQTLFVVLGRLQEKPDFLFEMKNLLFPRLSGQSLVHELAWIDESDGFMGSISGFALKAMFSKVPYFVTKFNDEAYRIADMPNHSERLLFASKNQMLSDKKESVELLRKGLSLFSPSKSKPKTKVTPKSPNQWNYQGLSEQVDDFDSALVKFHELIETRNIASALPFLDNNLRKLIKDKNQEETYYYNKAKLLYSIQRYADSKRSAEKLLSINKDSVRSNELVNKINLRLLLSNLETFERLNSDAPQDLAEYHLTVINAYVQLGEYKVAYDLLEKSISEDSENDKLLSLKKHIIVKMDSIPS